jgi:ABC-type transport system substrate-binding protein
VPIDYGAFRPHYIHVKVDDPFSAGCLHVFDSSARATPTSSLNLYYYSKNLAGSAIDNPELDKIINEIPTVMDAGRRKELTRRAYDIVWQEKTILPLFDLDALYGINPKVVGKWQPISGFPYLGLVFEGVKPK